MSKELTFFEFDSFQDSELGATQLKEFKAYLEEVWANRNRFWNYSNKESEEIDPDVRQYRQGLLRFDGNYISSRNYVGFIQYEKLRINIYPKLFAKKGKSTQQECHLYLHNLLYWLSYCDRVRFPFSQVDYLPQDTDNLLEALIYLFSRYTSQLLAQSPYQCYEEITEPTEYLRGSLATSHYLREHVVTGNWQHFYCRYEPFRYDNRFNQIIRYVTRILLIVSSNEQNQETLNQILFRLEEVTDTYCSYEDCSKVKLNRLHTEWEPVLAMCRLFLAGQMVSPNREENPNFCFLLPMEYVYEDFIAGFLFRHFSDQFTLSFQGPGKALTEEGIFMLLPDIVLFNKATKQQLILDTKYKARPYPFKDSAKGDVSQSDMYQMVSYALRNKCKEVILLYPSSFWQPKQIDRNLRFTVNAPWLTEFTIIIRAEEVNICGYNRAEIYEKLIFTLEKIIL